MKIEEFEYIEQIYIRLETIEYLFYKKYANDEAHFEFGKLLELVKNIWIETENIEED